MKTELLDVALVTGVVCLLLFVREIVINLTKQSKVLVRSRTGVMIRRSRNPATAGHPIVKSEYRADR